MNDLSKNAAARNAARPAEERVFTNKRAEGKARSRLRLLAAAKQLVMERGYEGATVREIAAAAGLSTGAVFASFADKAELFDAVMQDDCEAQAEAMRRAAEIGGSVADRLLGVLGAAYAFHLDQLELLRAGMSASWAHGLKGELGDRPPRAVAMELFHEILADAVKDGELAGSAKLDLTAEMLWHCYVGNYRRVLFADWDLAQLKSHTAEEIDLLLSGQRRTPIGGQGHARA